MRAGGEMKKFRNGSSPQVCREGARYHVPRDASYLSPVSRVRDTKLNGPPKRHYRSDVIITLNNERNREREDRGNVAQQLAGGVRAASIQPTERITRAREVLRLPLNSGGAQLLISHNGWNLAWRNAFIFARPSIIAYFLTRMADLAGSYNKTRRERMALVKNKSKSTLKRIKQESAHRAVRARVSLLSSLNIKFHSL